MKTKIKITYPAPMDSEKDSTITKLMESIGAKWYAQGTNLIEKERDICFDLEV